MRKILAKKGMDASIFKDGEDEQGVDEVDCEIEGDEDLVQASTTYEPQNVSSTETSSQSPTVQENTQNVSLVERYNSAKDPVAITSQSVSERVDDDRLSVISEVSSSGSQKSPRRKRRKITDSISELKALGGRSPIPKRLTSEPTSFSPPHTSQFSPFAVFSPTRKETFRSPTTAKRKLKKRKSSGIMGF